MSSIRNFLRSELDMTQYETNIFLALVKIGRGSATEIQKTSMEIGKGVPLSRTYQVLQKLCRDGLIVTEGGTRTQIYSLADPAQSLQRFVELERVQSEKRIQQGQF